MADEGSSPTDLLVVTDDPLLVEEARFAFPSGFSVRFSRDSREAWQAIADAVPSAIVVDLQTGSAGGYGLTKDLRAREKLAGVPVLILLERDQDAWLAMQSGANAYRTKPVEATELVARVLELLDHQPTPS